MTGKSETVPKSMRPVFDAITGLTDKLCQEHLNDEYRQLARQATAALCRKRPSPLARGDAAGWACGVLYALGHMNFLFDKNQKPHLKASELCERFGVSQSGGSAKAKAVRDALKMSQINLNWCLPSRLKDHPLTWMLTVNGLLVDIRRMPREVQEIAFRKGLIPYIPTLDGEPARDQNVSGSAPAGTLSVYQLKVTLRGIEPPIWRYIQVPGDYTLYDLHCVLQVVMGWKECHLHEFAVGDARYSTLYDDDDVDLAGDVIDDGEVTLGQVAPGAGGKFTYTYDFGDGWKHDILVQKILEPAPGVTYPVCLGGERACPPEDCGGTPGYERFLEAIRNPRHEEHDRLLRWVGGAFDSEAFDVEAANRSLKREKASGYVR